MDGLAKAGGVAQVVGNHNGGVEALEVQHEHGVVVEAALRLHHQRHRLHRWLAAHLLLRRRDLHTRVGLNANPRPLGVAELQPTSRGKGLVGPNGATLLLLLGRASPMMSRSACGADTASEYCWAQSVMHATCCCAGVHVERQPRLRPCGSSCGA